MQYFQKVLLFLASGMGSPSNYMSLCLKTESVSEIIHFEKIKIMEEVQETEINCIKYNLTHNCIILYLPMLQVFDIGKGNNTPITGLQFHRVPGSEKYFVLVTTPNRLYQFIGYVTNSDEKPLLQQIFNSYLNVPGKKKKKFYLLTVLCSYAVSSPDCVVSDDTMFHK
jgi:hypothetical protein